MDAYWRWSVADSVTLTINGQRLAVPAHTTVAAALANAGIAARRSVSGEPRTSLCGMGVCQECRVQIDRHLHQRACEIDVREGMEVQTHV